MSIAANTFQKINQLPEGLVFTYKDVLSDTNQTEAVIKALNRMAQAGTIGKLAKGKFYKPEDSPFGPLKPSMYEVLKDLLVKDGKRVGYFTGTSVQNELGLTTQVSKTIEIGRNEVSPALIRGFYSIAFIRQYNPITKASIPLLQILDAIRTMKQLPDTAPEDVVLRLKSLVADLDENKQARMVQLSKKYPPSTRALLGAFIDELGKDEMALELLDSLNPVTKYNLPGARKVLTCAQKWNIL